jgi:hypothetical protein
MAALLVNVSTLPVPAWRAPTGSQLVGASEAEC